MMRKLKAHLFVAAVLSVATSSLTGCALFGAPATVGGEGPPVSTSGIIEAEGGLEGILTQNAIMHASKSPYYIIGDFIVSQGVTLTIFPGTVLRVNPNVSIYIDGSLRAEGRIESPVTITSNRASPREGDWGKIELAGSSNLLQFVKIEYAATCISFSKGGGNLSNIKVSNCETGLSFSREASPSLSYVTVTNSDIGLFFDDKSSPTIANSKIESNGTGVRIGNSSSPQVNRTSIINNRSDGVVCDVSSSLVINESNIYGNEANGGYDMRVATSSSTITSTLIDAKFNWWGTTDETIVREHIYDGDDDGALRKVDYSGFKDAEVPIGIVDF
jgi:hypothetical protein